MTKLTFRPLKKVVLGAAALLAVLGAAQAASPGYRDLDAENTLVIDTSKGQIVVEMYPQVAPASVERLKTLARQKFYDGQIFHRVIEGFMAQTGDPKGTGENGSTLPDIPGEFSFRRDAGFTLRETAHSRGMVQGYVGALPVTSQADELMALTKDSKVAAWGAFCQGVLGMARAGGKDSANSQFFLMRGNNPSLEKNYTAFGYVVSGIDVVKKLKIGQPPKDPDSMKRVRVLADIPVAERPKIEVMDTSSGAFNAEVERVRKKEGPAFSSCDLSVPVKVTP